MKTRLPRCVITNGRCSAGGCCGDEVIAGVALGAALSFCVFREDELSGVASGTGGRIVGKKVSSFGANLFASSFVENSIATKIIGTSVRAGQPANIRRDVPNSSECFFKKLTTDLNCGPGSASLMIGSTIS